MFVFEEPDGIFGIDIMIFDFNLPQMSLRVNMKSFKKYRKQRKIFLIL